MSANEYLSRGVSPTKEDVHRAIDHVSKGLFPGAICKLVADPAVEGAAAVIYADGAGSKSSLACMVYKESGSADVFHGIAQDSAVMNLDDMLCVGACDRFLLSNTIARNARRCGPGVTRACQSVRSWIARRSPRET